MKCIRLLYAREVAVIVFNMSDIYGIKVNFYCIDT